MGERPSIDKDFSGIDLPEGGGHWLRLMRLTGLFLLDRGAFAKIYGPLERAAIAASVDLLGAPLTAGTVWHHTDQLAHADLIFSGWGMPVVDDKFLTAAPRLKAIFYGAGSIRGFTTPAMWTRGIVVTSAYAANALPVAEYTLATILLSLKSFWRHAAGTRGHVNGRLRLPVAGAYQSTVGIISLGMVGRDVCRRLRQHDLHIIAHDPFAKPVEGVEMVALDEIFRRADVVSLHTPNLPATRGMITGSHFALMKPGATFINTARGAVVRETELIDVLRQRPDLTAILDVTDPEPPAPDSSLRSLPNVILTPHIAGSMDGECRRMGQAMVEELRRYLASQPLQSQITQDQAALLA